MSNITSNTILKTFVTNLSIQGCGLATGIITARLLQPAGRGELAAIILWPAIFAGLGIMGTNWAVAREAAARPDEEADLARTSVVLGLLLAGFTMILGYLFIPYLLPADKQNLVWLTRFYLVWLPLNFVALNLIALDQGRLRWGRFNMVRMSVVLPYLIFLLCFWAAKVDQVFWFIVALLASNLVAFVLRLGLQWKGIIRGKVRLPLITCLFRQGFPFFLSSISAVAALQVDKALVVSLLRPEMVGCYAAAFSFASVHASLGGALGITSFAALANEPDPEKQGRFLSQIFRQATLLYVVAGSGVAICSPLLIVPLFGSAFAPAVKPAIILSLATSLNALNEILNEGLRGLGKTFPGITAQLISASVVALLAWSLIRSRGLMGMAGAVLIGSGVQLAIMLAIVTVRLRLSPANFWGLRLGEVRVLYGRLISVWPFSGGA